MLLRSFSLAVFLAAATTAAGFQDSGFRRSESSQEPKRATVTSSRTGSRTTYFPSRNSDSSSVSKNPDTPAKTYATPQPTATPSLVPEAAQAPKAAKIPAKPTLPTQAKPLNAGAKQAVHSDDAATSTKRSVTPASFVDRSSGGDAGFDAYLDTTAPPQPRRPSVRKPTPLPSPPAAEPEFELDEPQPMEQRVKTGGTATAPPECSR